MDRDDTPTPPALLDPDHRIPGKPVVRVNDVEPSNVVLGPEHMVNERPAHVVDFVHKIGVQIERTAMIVYAVYALIMGLAMSHAREHVHLLALPL